MNWDELAKLGKENLELERRLKMAKENEKQKRIAKMKRKLDALQRMLDDAGIDTNKKPYMEMGGPGWLDKQAEETCDANDYARAEDEDYTSQGRRGTVSRWMEAQRKAKARAEELDRLFQTAYPAQTAGLSFHDIDCNELTLRNLPSSRRRNQVPNRFSIKQANRIFAHTFLEDCTSESCG